MYIYLHTDIGPTVKIRPRFIRLPSERLASSTPFSPSFGVRVYKRPVYGLAGVCWW